MELMVQDLTPSMCDPVNVELMVQDLTPSMRSSMQDLTPSMTPSMRDPVNASMKTRPRQCTLLEDIIDESDRYESSIITCGKQLEPILEALMSPAGQVILKGLRLNP